MSTYKEIFGKPIKVLSGDPAPTPVTYTVTVANPGSGNRYYIDGVLTPTLELYEGNTYNFDYSAASSHPFRFSTASDGTHSGGSEYTTGVTVDSNITTIVVASGAPTLFYYCSSHSGMGGTALTPASPDEYVGQIWYNSTSGKFKSIVAGSAWSSSGPYIGNQSYTAGFGTQLAGVLAGGDTGSGPPACTNISAEYNGSGWTTTGSLNTARRGLSAAGSSPQTAGVVFGGSDGSVPTQYAKTEEYNGTAWAAGNDMPTNRNNFAGLGIQTAAVAFGAGPAPGVTSVEYDGTNWTAGGDLNVGRASTSSGAGTLTAGLAAGGGPNPAVNGAVEHYNGTAWTAVTALPAVREKLGLVGTQTDALQSGGSTYPASPGIQNTSFSYNGTAWTAQANLGTGRYSHGTGGNGPANYVIGGRPLNSTTEEFTSSINVITAGAWSSGGLMGTGRYRMSGQNIGTKDAGMAIGGRGSFPSTAPSVTVSSVEEYDGSSWSEVNNMPTSLDMMGSFGVQTAALQFAGYGGPGAGPNPAPGGARINPAASNEYDGTNWTSSGAYPAATNALAAAGTQTAGLGFAGNTGSVTNATAEYNGSSWTASNNLGTARDALGGAGIQTAALAIGGPPGPEKAVEEYDGTNWTTGGDLPTGSNQNGTGGTQTNALLFGGNVSPTTLVLGYDGTSWSTRPSISTARYGGSNGNSTTSGAYFAGGGGSASGTQRQTTEEFSPESTTLNVKTLTTS